ncbi:MAG: hypothetical protein WCI05_18000 [Myxococcales bacterium]
MSANERVTKLQALLARVQARRHETDAGAAVVAPMEVKADKPAAPIVLEVKTAVEVRKGTPQVQATPPAVAAFPRGSDVAGAVAEFEELSLPPEPMHPEVIGPVLVDTSEVVQVVGEARAFAPQSFGELLAATLALG